MELLATPLNSNETKKISIWNTGPYPPVVYFPQALGAYLARLFGGTAGAVYYAMRLGSVLFVALCVFMALRLLPEKGLLIFLLAMMPMFLVETASISADAATYGICFLASAYILSLCSNDDRLTFGQMLTLLMLSVAVGLAKQVYGTVMLLYFLIPVGRMGNLRRYLLFGGLVLFVCLASSLAWTYFSSVRYGTAMAVTSNEIARTQVASFLHNPIKVIFLCLKSSILQIRFLAASFIGILGWLTILMPMWFYALYAVGLIVAAMYGHMKLLLRHRLIMFAGSFASILAIYLYEYLAWYQSSPDIVGGVQGRYFIPIAVMALSIFSCRPALKHERLIALAAGAISIITTIAVSYAYFYC